MSGERASAPSAVCRSLRAFFLALSFLFAAVSPAEEFSPVGLWYAKVSPTESNPVDFQVRIARRGKGLVASLTNGASSEPFGDVGWDGRTLTLGLARQEGKILASPKGNALEGTFVRVDATGTRDLPFFASRVAPEPARVVRPGVSVSGTWAAEIAQPGGGPEKVVAQFAQKGTTVTGTMTSASGSYGPLHGTFDGEQLVLMVFTGDFIYRFTAEILPDGTLVGEFRSGRNPPVDWKAVRQTGS